MVPRDRSLVRNVGGMRSARYWEWEITHGWQHDLSEAL